ncbi:MAG: hypothetical protein ACI9VR_003608 [Cognaticolwellia sp.]|jgi:hypothetical protein
MAFFDQLRRSFKRLLSGIDAMEDQARAEDPLRSAREIQQRGAGAVEVKGGVEDLLELELDQPIDDLELEEISIDQEDSLLELDDDRPPLEALLGPVSGRWELSHEDTEEVTELAIPADSLARLTELADVEDSASRDLTEQLNRGVREEVTEVTMLHELPPIVPPTELAMTEMESMYTEAGAIWTASESTIGLDEDLNDEPSEDFGLGSFSWNEEDAELGQEAARFPNSLKLPDEQVIEQLRLAHYPSLVQASDKALHTLAKVDQQLLHEVQELGSAVGGLLLCRETVWEAACMWSCLQLDPTLRALWAGSDLEEAETWRRMAWAAWPYLPDLLQAGGGLDPFGIHESMVATRALLEKRREVVEADSALEQAMESLPVEDCGLFALEGFEWLA